MLRRMASPPRTRESEEERQRRLNARTLVIASAASASAAAVTSQLWIRGTWIAAAITPVIVAVVSELLHRPSERIARALTTDQPQLILDEPPEPATDAVRPDRDAPRPDPAAPPVARPSSRGGVSGAPGPVRVYRQPAQVSKPPRIAVGVVLTTALIALLVAVVVITVPELIVGQSLGSGDNATTFGGGKARHKSSKVGSDHHEHGHAGPHALGHHEHEHGHPEHRTVHGAHDDPHNQHSHDSRAGPHSPDHSLSGKRPAACHHLPVMGHHHGHVHDAGGNSRRLSVALALITSFMALEVVAGILASSLALLSDAAHMLTDAGAIALALLAARLARRPAGGGFTFGLRRAEILSAQVNGAHLVALACSCSTRASSASRTRPTWRARRCWSWPWWGLG